MNSLLFSTSAPSVSCSRCDRFIAVTSKKIVANPSGPSGATEIEKCLSIGAKWVSKRSGVPVRGTLENSAR